jgi:hypothetical protein
MDVAYTFDRESREQQLMVCATQEEWQQVMINLDGVGHSPATLELLKGLKSWGVRKSWGADS